MRSLCSVIKGYSLSPQFGQRADNVGTNTIELKLASLFSSSKIMPRPPAGGSRCHPSGSDRPHSRSVRAFVNRLEELAQMFRAASCDRSSVLGASVTASLNGGRPAVKMGQVSLAYRGSQLLAYMRADHACDHEFACLRMPYPYALQTLRSSGGLQHWFSHYQRYMPTRVGNRSPCLRSRVRPSGEREYGELDFLFRVRKFGASTHRFGLLSTHTFVPHRDCQSGPYRSFS